MPHSTRSRLARLTTDRPVVAFSAPAIGLSWTVWIATFSATAPRSGLRFLGMALGAFAPGAAGATVTRLRGESVRAWLGATVEWRRPLRWNGLAIAVPVVGALGVAGAVPRGLRNARLRVGFATREANSSIVATVVL